MRTQHNPDGGRRTVTVAALAGLAVCVAVVALFVVFRADRGRTVSRPPAVSGTNRPAVTLAGASLPAAEDTHRVLASIRPVREERTGETPAPAAPGVENPREPHPRKPEPPRRPPPGGTVAGEYTIGFPSANSVSYFLSSEKPAGIEVAGVISELNCVRVKAVDESALKSLLGELAPEAKLTPNYLVSVPVPVSEVESPQSSGVPHRGFGAGALTWLGVGEGNGDWGRGVTVAILDTGVEYHPALNESAIMRIEPESMASDAGGAAPNGHGTAVAGILAGTAAETRGIVPAATLLSVKVLSAGGTGDSYTLARGIVQAVDRGARVLNLCLGGPGDSVAVREAVAYAQEKGAVVVAAAGNEGKGAVWYPAAYDGVVAVVAVDADGLRMEFSNFGKEIDIAAPGLGVEAIQPGGENILFSGTSAAVPFVSGALASLLASSPGLSAGDAVSILCANCDDYGAPGKDAQFGYGALDVGRLTDRDKKGIHDIAAADHFVPPVTEPGRPIVCSISFQNRGTEALDRIEARVLVGGKLMSFNYEGVEVGETVGAQFEITPADIAQFPGGVPVWSEARIPGHQDDRPDNNLKRSVLTLTRQ